MIPVSKVNEAGVKEYNYIKYEYILYLALMGVAFLFPFLRVGDISLQEGGFQWKYIFEAWIDLLPFVALLVVHTLFLLPVLLNKRKFGKYAILTFILVCMFAGYTYVNFSNKMQRMPEPPVQAEIQGVKPPLRPAPPIVRPPFSPGVQGPVIFNTLFAVMILGCNLAIRLMFKHYNDMRLMEKLEKTRISPHFFMNSLNNIHGMVEINPGKAQEMILELSGMMRYVLYESSSSCIPLHKEIDFISNYVALMRERFSKDKVDIALKIENGLCSENINVPPLVFINLIENGFKHGVNYSGHSFVEICLSKMQDRLQLVCRNSIHLSSNGTQGQGIGIENIRKRMDILFPDNYSLDMYTDNHNNTFTVKLTIPVTHGK